MSRRASSLLALLLLVVLLIAINVFADTMLSRARLDLTENRLYTLSQGTTRILRGLDEPIGLTLYVSDSLMAGRPGLQAYAKRVRDVLEEFELLSNGAVSVEVVDPTPFSEAESRAKQQGIAGNPVGLSGEALYFGLVGVNSTDGREVVPFLDPAEERFLEYELSRMIYTLANPERRTVGVISSLPLDGGTPMPGAPPQRPWQILRELRTVFDLLPLGVAVDSIPDEVDVLMIVHPKELSESTLRAIDAFALSGRGVLAFIDPLCEADMPPGAQQNPMVLMNANRSSNLPRLMQAWGVVMTRDQVATDLGSAVRGQSPDGSGVIPYIQYLRLQDNSFEREDAVTSQLSMMLFGVAGPLVAAPDATTTFTPLIQTSDQAMLVETQRVSFFPQPAELLEGYAPRGDPITIAARISGPVRSAFAAAPDGDADPSQVSQGRIDVIVVADADMLADRWWAQEIRRGQSVLGYMKISDNADFVTNAVDNLSGSSDLIQIRARGTFARPFTRVEEIQQEAEQRWQAERQRLETRRRETEQKIAELQQNRPAGEGFVLSPEQQAEINRFQEELVSTEAQLRDVRFNLRRDVERLGWQIKWLNIAAAPALVALVAVFLASYRGIRRRLDRRALSARG